MLAPFPRLYWPKPVPPATSRYFPAPVTEGAKPNPAPPCPRRHKMAAAGALPRPVSIRARDPLAERYWLRRRRMWREVGACGAAPLRVRRWVRGSSRHPACSRPPFLRDTAPPGSAPHCWGAFPGPVLAALQFPRLLASPRPSPPCLSWWR